jgi:hypothetical protein
MPLPIRRIIYTILLPLLLLAKLSSVAREIVMTLEIFQPSDLNRRGRAVLDAARGGIARIRDTDGTSLVLLPEERVQALQHIARTAATLVRIEVALEKAPDALADALATSDWAWARVFDVEDFQEFVRDVRRALLAAVHEEDSHLLDDTLQRWRVTARSLDDPLRREILYGTFRPEDFVEVSRPEAASP